VSEYVITYEITIEAEDKDAAIDGANKILYTGEEHADDVQLIDWVRTVK